jgi:2-polyprenyl-6-methoxyphenol hydroxylase-like FAD-dependent oxidoreductase
MKDVLIIGGGIGGLTLALFLHKAGIPCQVYESAREIQAMGTGINLLPYATEKLAELGLLEKLSAISVETKESVFCNRFGQVIFKRPAGLLGGYKTPQFSIHRGELQCLLLNEVRNKLGNENVHIGWRCTDVVQKDDYVMAEFINPQGEVLPKQKGSLLIGCDGIHSKIRQLFYPEEGAPLYQGINLWRGMTKWKPFFSGASMLRIGLPESGKLVIYPIKDNIDGKGTQLINWVAEIEVERHSIQDWNKEGKLSDIEDYFKHWAFDWLDVPAMLKACKGPILQYPMMDKEAVSQWSFGRVSLLGDAAHPMVPLGSNGAGQAILDAAELTRCLSYYHDPIFSLQKYEETRLTQTSKIIQIDRARTQDKLLNEVHLRTQDSPFLSIEQVMSSDELIKFSEPTYQSQLYA